MSDNEFKPVRTELDRDEYETFREFGRKRGSTVKEAAHEALVSRIERQRRADPNDRAFTVLDELDDLSAAVETDARRPADLVDEWSGDDVAFTLADDPPTGSDDHLWSTQSRHRSGRLGGRPPS